MTATIAERVAAGAEWLNDNEPGWYNRIDLDSLDIASPCGCLLGQIYGDYADAPYVARWGTGSSYAADDRGFNTDYDEEFATLTAEWRKVVLAHRASLGGESP